MLMLDKTHFTLITQPGVQFISGQSASAFKSLIKGAECSAQELMLETLNNPMYDSIVLG